MSDLVVPKSIMKFVMDTNDRITFAANNMEVGDFTLPEINAIKEFEKLRLTSGIALTSYLLRGTYLLKIEQGELWKYLPGSYESMEAAVRDYAKLNTTQMSNAMSLVKYVLPYVEQHMGMDIGEFWGSMSESMVVECIPYMRAIISGEDSKSSSVNSKVDEIMSQVADAEDPQRAAMEFIMETVNAQPTVAEFRAKMKGSDLLFNEGCVIKYDDGRIVAIFPDLSEEGLAQLMKARNEMVYFNDVKRGETKKHNGIIISRTP